MKREFKISVVAKLESGKPLAQIAPPIMASIQVFPANGNTSWPRVPRERTASMATGVSMRPGSPKLWRLAGQAHAENELGRPKGQSQPAIGASRSF